jgi:hypothetical protein
VTVRRPEDSRHTESAASAGADLRLGVTTTHYQFADDVRQVTRALGAHRLPFDRLVGLAATVPGPDTCAQNFLLVEAAADGWWYTAPRPGGEPVGVLMTDADLSRAGRLAHPAAWQARLAAAPATSERLAGRTASAPKAFPAASHRLRRGTDPRPWLAVGDAALDAECTEYLPGRAALYRLEQRFTSPFWARRS